MTTHYQPTNEGGMSALDDRDTHELIEQCLPHLQQLVEDYEPCTDSDWPTQNETPEETEQRLAYGTIKTALELLQRVQREASTRTTHDAPESYCTRCSMTLLPTEPYPTGLRTEQALCEICAQTYDPHTATDKNVLIVGHMLYAKLLGIEQRVNERAALDTAPETVL